MLEENLRFNVQQAHKYSDASLSASTEHERLLFTRTARYYHRCADYLQAKVDSNKVGGPNDPD
jgi:hypothetical protein